jgi:plastocyanin
VLLLASVLPARPALAAIAPVDIVDGPSQSDFAFRPANITVRVGDTVTWTNIGRLPHTSTSDTSVWDSGRLTTGQSFSFQFAKAGIYPYLCTIHPFMRGTVTVLDAPVTPRVFVATAHLSGAEEVPPVTDTAGTGVAAFRLSRDGTALDYTLEVNNLTSAPVAAHIHAPAPPGQNAPVVVFLFPANPRSTCAVRENQLHCKGEITAADLVGPLAGRTLADLIGAMNAGNTYTNVHTSRHPGGEIRGQNEPVAFVLE